jgi:hypothetical protein
LTSTRAGQHLVLGAAVGGRSEWGRAGAWPPPHEPPPPLIQFPRYEGTLSLGPLGNQSIVLHPKSG